jgi:polysaccharide biosynthesis protein PslH
VRVLFLVPHALLPANTGNKRLTDGLLRYLTSIARCDIAMLVDPDTDQDALELAVREAYPDVEKVLCFRRGVGSAAALARTRALVRGVHPAFGRYDSAEFRAWLTRHVAVGRKYDLVHFDMMLMAPYRHVCGDTPTVLVASDAYSRAARSVRYIATRPRYMVTTRMQEILHRRFERSEYPKFSAVCVVSRPDLEYLRALVPAARFRRIGIAVSPEFISQPPRSFPVQERAAGVLCTGSLDHEGVAQGVLEFLVDSVPSLRADHAETDFVFLGRNPLPFLERAVAAAPGARHVDYVEDYREFLDRDWVYAYPQRCGSGLQTKVQQAMALGLPVVGYPEAFEGLDVTPGRDCLVCETPGQFTDAVRSLLDSAELRDRIGRAGAAHVRTVFSAEATGAGMLAVYREVLHSDALAAAR